MNNKLMEVLKYNIYQYDINEAYTYKGKIVYTGNSTFNNVTRHQFVFSEDHQIVNIGMKNNVIVTMNCTCTDYQKRNSCIHIPAVVITQSNYLNPSDETDYLIVKSRDILNKFSKNHNPGTIKKELELEFTIDIKRTYRGYDYIVHFRIGSDKLYSMGSKYNKFIKSYHDQVGNVEFGKNFIYNPEKYYFSKENTRILDFLYTNADYHRNSIYIEEKEFPKFLELLRNTHFCINRLGWFNTISEENPIDITLSKDEDIYRLNVDIPEDLVPLVKSFEYVYCNRNIYHLDSQLRRLIATMVEEEMDSLVFNEKDLDSFSLGVLPIVKKDLKLDDELKDLQILTKAEAKLYFDINANDITCKPIIIYGNEEVEFFKENTKVLRDEAYETKLINDLISHGFVLNKNKFILNDIELIVEFLENGLDELATHYAVFTSEKLKQTDIKKKINISSTFSIGKDNILSFDFNLDGIDSKELSNVFSSLKNKKKYHKLKSGDIISLEDESLIELSELVEDLDIDYKSGTGTIPKYKALYLDSLRNNRYSIINTDNSFNAFIEKFSKYKNAQLEFSNQERKILRPYQLEGVQWLYNIHKCDLGGILADEMGLGKSIQTIYFFKYLLKEDKDAKFMIVCPTALVYNWLNEFKKFAPDIKVDTFVGDKEKRIAKIKNSKVSVFITSYGTLREDEEVYAEKLFKVCVIDEAQNIKNPLAKNTKSVKKIKAETKIALTGTPLENSVGELWSIFDFIMPGLLSSLTKFNERYRFKEMDDEALESLGHLNRLISPFIMRRKKSEVLKDLPDKIENSIYIDLDKEQKKLYAAEIKNVEEQMDELLAQGTFTKQKMIILSLLTRLRQLCIDPRLVFENYKGKSAKIENLVRVVEELISNNHKILLFSSFKSAFDIISKEFNKHNITYYQIDGSVSAKNRQELVDKFNNDDTNVFLITLKSGGTGLNLTSADVVIHLDLWWNPQAENQATDRAHRIGQKNKVEVIKLVSSGTIEEKILDLQKKKKALSDTLIEKNENSDILSALTEKDIRNLLTYENID